jgi:hypothetical protein
MKEKKATKVYTLKVRLTEHEQAKLEAHAAKHDMTLSRTIREYIRRLPVPHNARKQRENTKHMNICSYIDETKLNSLLTDEHSESLQTVDFW